MSTRDPRSARSPLSLLAGAACLLVVSVGAPGCGQRSEPPRSPAMEAPSTEPASGTTPGGTAQEGNSVEAMPLEARRAQLPASLRIEVPVPNGRVLSATEQDQNGQGAWTYEIETDSSAAALEDWYTTIYGLRSWKVKERSGFGDSGVTLVFVKNEAQSVIQIKPTESGSAVQASIGIGIPVGETY